MTTATTSAPVLAVDRSIATKFVSGVTQPVFTFGIPCGKVGAKVRQLEVLTANSHIEVGACPICDSKPPKNRIEVPPSTNAPPELTVGGGRIFGIEADPMIAWPPTAGIVKGLIM